MTSLRQIEANRRNAQLSTGPRTDVGKQKSRRNSIRHGLTAETVIGTLEDAEDYAAFELAVTSDFEAQTAVERELVLRLASLLWRLRRATAIESGLFTRPRQLLQFRRQRQTHRDAGTIEQNLYKLALVPVESQRKDEQHNRLISRSSSVKPGSRTQEDDLTRSFVRLTKLSNYPLDRLTRYEGRLWRQTYQILFTLLSLNRRNSWSSKRGRLR